MYFQNLIQLWELQNPNAGYLSTAEINPAIDKQALEEYLLSEFGEMQALYGTVSLFIGKVNSFFKIHKYNIDKLCETLNYEYDPLNNFGWERTQRTDSTEDTTMDRDRNLKFDTERNTTDNQNKNIDFDTNRTTTDDNTETTDRTKTTTGNISETNVHFVSAFNDDESPEQIGTDIYGHPIYKYNDTEEYRNTISQSNTETVKDTGTVKDNRDIVTGGKDKTVETLSDTENKTGTDTTKETINDVGKKVGDENIVEKKKGNLGKSYQSLIEEERRLAEFNIYKWIGNHFSKELLISVW